MSSDAREHQCETKTVQEFVVESPNVKYTPETIESEYVYETTRVTPRAPGSGYTVTPVRIPYSFKTERKIPKLGLMMVGWGGNNGTTLTGGILANKHHLTWHTKHGVQEPNFFGSITQAATVRLGDGPNGEQIFVPFKRMAPLVEPCDIVLGGWDISNLNLADACERAEVYEYELQQKLRPYMEKMKPLPAVYYKDYIATNQEVRADNVIPGTKQQHLDKIRADLREFKAKNGVDKVIVLWTATTERFSEIRAGLNDTADNLLKSIANNESEVAPSTIYAVACCLEGVSYINGSPQNTLVPGVIELAHRHGVFIGGDDFKTGQTKIKSVLADFLVSAGLKPRSIVSYNHLGNNDGRNLSSPKQFRSKEISKASVVDDCVASNQILYKKGEHPDHTIVIKYVPFVKDSKRALDEYTSEIFMGGMNTITLNNVCEDSLLAGPVMLDLVLLCEWMERVSYKVPGMKNYEKFDNILSVLSYLFKAPVVSKGAPVINALFRQRTALVNIMRACAGLPADNDMLLEFRTKGRV